MSEDCIQRHAWGIDRAAAVYYRSRAAVSRAKRRPEAPGRSDVSDPATTRDLPPIEIGEIVLKTSRYDEMKAWYRLVLGVEPYLDTERFSFHRLRYAYPYTQQLVIFNIPGLSGVLPESAGLHHMQFKHGSLAELLDRYALLRDAGITPGRTLHHGVAIAGYYRDVDGNEVELSGSCFETNEEYLAHLRSEQYLTRSGAGIDVELGDLLRRYREGATLAELRRYPDEQG
jgi:catechol 2,3-dioxygenase-like lactoylglutathione lyase family enzyme